MMAHADTEVALPDVGRLIRYRKKAKDNWMTGTVDLVWLALDEAAVNVNGQTIIPAFGDEWQYVEGLC